MPIDANQAAGVLSFLRSHDTYVIVGHREPDGDCISSQLVLASYLRRHGKTAVLLSSGPFTRVEIARYREEFLERAPNLGPDPAVVVLDCSSLSRIGPAGDTLPPGLPLAFIDHHAAGEASGEARCIDPGAPAVAYLVQLLIEESGDRPTAEEARLLLFGLCTDTGFFRHLDERSAPVLAAASRLVAAGASPKAAFDMMNGGKPFESRTLMGLLLSRAERRYDGKLIVTWMGLPDMERFGLVGRDSDMLYQLLMTVEGMEVAVVVRQEKPGECTVGFRSRETVDVASVAAAFGGGGHRLAAGLHIRGEMEEVRDRIIAAFSPILGQGAV